jgi:plasmid stabilization system protein ParE
MLQVALSARALSDIARVLDETQFLFGESARIRYQLLIEQSLVDLRGIHPAEQSSPELALPEGVGAYHLSRSRMSVGRHERVKRPRHYLVYRVVHVELIEIVCLTHDRRDVSEQVNADDDVSSGP